MVDSPSVALGLLVVLALDEDLKGSYYVRNKFREDGVLDLP